MGKQYYACLFIQLTVPLLDVLSSIGTYQWLNSSRMMNFLKILFFRELFDFVFNCIISGVMIAYRFKQIELIPKIVTYCCCLLGFCNFLFLAPIVLAPSQYFMRYQNYFEQKLNTEELQIIMSHYRCCGLKTTDQFKSQKCRSRRFACLDAFVKSTSSVVRSKAFFTIVLSLLQAFGVFLLWEVHRSGEAIEQSEEEEYGEESRLLTSKKDPAEVEK